MDIIIRNIKKKDFGKIQKFALQGMNFTMYTENKIELYFYTKYFWYLELNRATEVLAAYMGNKLVGVLLADMDGKQKVTVSKWRKLYIKMVEWIMKVAYKGASDLYDETNKDMLKHFKTKYHPDGELNFLAVDPTIKGKGIGSKLLAELECREKGKLVYLFTNTGCTYQFYEHRGFERFDIRKIDIDVHEKKIPHDCFLYYKKLN